MYGEKLKGDCIYGCALNYQLFPKYKIRIQMGFSNYSVPHMTIPLQHTFESVELIKVNAITISVLAIRELLSHDNFSLYGGIGFIDYQIKTRVPAFNGDIHSLYGFGFPWGTVVLLGLTSSPSKSYHLKAEIHYVTGTDGQLFLTPLDWDGLKFLVSIGVKF